MLDWLTDKNCSGLSDCCLTFQYVKDTSWRHLKIYNWKWWIYRLQLADSCAWYSCLRLETIRIIRLRFEERLWWKKMKCYSTGFYILVGFRESALNSISLQEHCKKTWRNGPIFKMLDGLEKLHNVKLVFDGHNNQHASFVLLNPTFATHISSGYRYVLQLMTKIRQTKKYVWVTTIIKIK